MDFIHSDQARPCLDGINLSMYGGRKLAIIGRSGRYDINRMLSVVFESVN